MNPTMKKALLSLAVCSAAGCGGTDPTKEVGNHMNVTVSATSETIAGNFVSINANVTSSPAAISNMNWTIQKTGNSPDIALLNSDCKIKSVSSSGSTLDPISNWSCAVDVLTPVTISSNADYKLVVTATDSKGNLSTGQNILTIKPNPTPPPSVTITGQSNVKSGDYVSYGCAAQGGTTLQKDKYSFQWVITNRDGVESFNISSPRDPASGQFIVPSVSSTKTITIGCRATDDSNKTGMALQNITISPAPEPRIIPSVVDGVVLSAGQTYKFDSSKTTWIDSYGTPLTNKDIYFQWIQQSGPIVNLVNANSPSPTVLFPANLTSSLEGKTTYVFTMMVSDKPFVNGQSAGTVQSIDAVYYVGTLSPITVTAGANAPVKSGTVGGASLTALGQSGYTLYYSWTQVSGPKVTIGGANRNTISFLAPTLTTSESVPIVFRVAISYEPIAAYNPGTLFTDVLVVVTP